MRILNVNSSLELKTGGGGAERTFQMTRFLAGRGELCTVLTLDTGFDAERATALAPANVVALASVWRRFHVPRISYKNWMIIRRLVDESDIVHLMAHWSVLNILVYVAIRLAAKPYVVCPAGSLPLFGRSRWLKRLYNAVAGNAIIRNASGWIAVTRGEFSHFQSYGVSSSRVTVIPNGVCEGDFSVADTNALLREHGLPEGDVILFMGRLNLIKGPDLLLQAFVLVSNQLPDCHLVFAGPDGGMLSGLRELVAKEKLTDRVHFLGYIGGVEKSAAYRCASLLVVPSRQEAMSIVALEAGICGTPVLLTDQCGFSDVLLVDPRLEVASTAVAIADGLACLLADRKDLKEVGASLRNFVMQRYSWDAIGSEYIRLYRSILSPTTGGHNRPTVDPDFGTAV